MIYSLNHYRQAKNLDNCYTFKEAFSPEECDQIIALGESLTKVKGQAGGAVNEDLRVSEISWIGPNSKFLTPGDPENPDAPVKPKEHHASEIYDKISSLVYKANAESWQCNIDGFREKLQYTRYVHDPDSPGVFTPHLDVGDGQPCRKLSAVIQLSDPEDYEGADLRIYRSINPASATRVRGSMTIFPSYLMHEVTPITAGTRSSLVVWLSGEPWR